MDFAELRKRMVDEQISVRGVKDKMVLSAFNKVERHKFVPEAYLNLSYADIPLSIGEGQTISQPYMAALMTELLGLTGKEKVLEIGTGSGYQAAILAELSKEVYSIERFEQIKNKAEKLLAQLGYKNTKIITADGTLGWPDEQLKFDRIIVTAASPDIPAPLLKQLKEGGKMVLPLGDSLGQMLILVEKDKAGRANTKNICGCVFVPLVGKYGWDK
ncbi:MAG: protein-L-isoaspartate(D-aspartate) O-methyltransferase [Candidatus Omnitrophica bacterium]|nr:protein-L-isoaspartate(D-aspartate) O-methyltransferase [Candidatus Omnitrophota bacterium]